MQHTFQKSICNYVSPVLRQVQDQEQTQELRLSDGMPDIGRVLAAWGQPVLRSKEWRGDGIGFSGGVMAWVLYAPEDGTNPRCIESWMPFQMKWDMASQPREGSIRIKCLLRSIDARSVSARKIMLRASLAALGEALVPSEAEYGVPGEVPQDVQLLTAAYPMRVPKEAGEKTFLLEEDLTLPGSCPMPEKLICYTLEPKLTEKKVLGNKLVFRGSGNLHVLYASEEGKLHSWDFELPFSQFADLEGSFSTDAQGGIHTAVTSLELDLDDESHLRLKCGLLAQFLVDDREVLELVEDAYSPRRSVETDVQMLMLPAILERKTEPVPMEQTVHQDAGVVADVDFRPDFPRLRRSGEMVNMELPAQFQVLFYGEDGALQSSTARAEETRQIPAGENSRLDALVMPGEGAQASPGADGITLRGIPQLQMTTVSEAGIPMVMGLELGEIQEPDPGRPSVILRRAGDARLWDIAKSTGSTVSAIRRANALETEPVRDQILLIPVS